MVTTRESTPNIGSDRVSLLDLNDDCLELIVKKLTLLQQYQISQLHTRFHNIVRTEWRMHLRHAILTRALLQDVSSDKEFVDFMTAIAFGGHLERLVIRDLDMRRLRLLTDCSFTQTIAFDLWADHGRGEDVAQNGEQFSDEDILMLQRVFPNLRVLKLRACQITGKYLRDFATLRQLSLDECQCLESENLRDIFSHVKLKKFDIMEDCDEVNCCDLVEIKKCPSLEHIKIADYHLCFDTDIINDILQMPCLRKLSIYSKNFVFDVVERISTNRIKTIEAFKFNGVVHNFGRFFEELAHMKKLHKLAFHDCRDDDIEGIRNHMLLGLSKQLPELQEVHFCSCDLENETGLLHFVANCRDLRLVNITNTRDVGNAFVWKCLELLAKQKWRSTPLELWIKGSSISSDIVEDPRYVHRNRLLNIDMKKITLDSNPPGVLKFTFFSEKK